MFLSNENVIEREASFGLLEQVFGFLFTTDESLAKQAARRPHANKKSSTAGQKLNTLAHSAG
jgi:hypothetical protein